MRSERYSSTSTTDTAQLGMKPNRAARKGWKKPLSRNRWMLSLGTRSMTKVSTMDTTNRAAHTSKVRLKASQISSPMELSLMWHSCSMFFLAKLSRCCSRFQIRSTA